MCGIAGWYRRERGPVPLGVICRQCDAIRHRGPDGSGELIDGDFGFGMRRLSILDVPGGTQPMSSPDGRYALVFNGEIYNHPALRRELEARGHIFLTRSDTETVLAAYLEWGDDAWPRLEGMFAVAVWDTAARRLTLARDHLGIKPLFVSEQGSGLAFASEIKALQVLPDHTFSIDDRSVHDFFSYGHVRRPRSIWREVRPLDPATVLTVGASGPAVTRSFWRPTLSRSEARAPAEWIEETRSLLVETTARHMQSDVPVGAFLSGGVDSAAVLAAMRKSSNAPITAFTIGHPGSAIDETAAAREIADHLGCEHAVLPLDMDEAQRELPAILAGFDEPFADLAAIPTWFASRLAGTHVKVVLCGEGGDELFAGYKRHRNARMLDWVRPARPLVRPLLGGVGRLPAVGPGLMQLRQHARRAGELLAAGNGYASFFAATRISSTRVRHVLLTPEFTTTQAANEDDLTLEREYFAGDAAGGSALKRFLFADLSVNLPSAMLTRLDRASMAHSLEARVPLLSPLVVDWALGVPDALKLRGLTGKYLLRRAIAPWLPASVGRRPKQGFQVPHARWLREDFGRFAEAAWRDSGAARLGYLDDRAVTALFAEHREGRADHARILYAVAAFAIWAESQP